MKKILREPLFHFLVLGGFLFALYSFLNKDEVDPSDYTIHITQSDVDRLVKAYQKNWNSRPDSATLAALITEEIQTEMLYREALRMNLDHNDEIIRRRLKQKYEFLVKDLVSLDQASEEDLRTFYQKRPELYQYPQAISFRQIYFNPDRRSTPKQDAEALFSQIQQSNQSAIAQKGDVFHLPTYFVKQDKAMVRQAFGKQFADQLFQFQQQGWVAPISSGYGYHVVHIDTIISASPIPFEQAQPTIAQDWQQQQQIDYNKRLIEQLKNQYTVKYEF